MRVVVVDFSPVTGISLAATAGDALGFFDPVDRENRMWIAHGAVIAAPKNIEMVAPNWRSGAGQDAPPSVSTKKWKLADVKRAQRAGDVVFAEVVDKKSLDHRHYWLAGDGVHLIDADVEQDVRAEVLGPRLVLLWNPGKQRFELLTPERRTAIALPALIAQDATRTPTYGRGVFALHESNAVVLIGAKRAYVFDLDELAALADQREVDWFFDPVFPRGDPDARQPGVVTMSKWGRTNIDLGTKKLSFTETPLVVGEQVELRELLWSALGSQVYREIRRADGSVIPCPGAPEYSGETTPVTAL